MTDHPHASVRRNSAVGRQRRAVESFGCAASAIGTVEPGMCLFAVTRGQWSMIDAILHCLDEVGPARVSCWTWTVAEYEVEVLTRLRRDSRITAGRLVIDYGARNKNAGIIREWQGTFGPESVRYVVNHSKIALIESESGLRLCLRGSMNLNLNPRFEQFDLSEGGAEFEMVRAIEDSLPYLTAGCSGAEVYEASKLSNAFPQETLQLFPKLKVWAK